MVDSLGELRQSSIISRTIAPPCDPPTPLVHRSDCTSRAGWEPSGPRGRPRGPRWAPARSAREPIVRSLGRSACPFGSGPERQGGVLRCRCAGRAARGDRWDHRRGARSSWPA
jgi:hypothetical protein